MQINATANWNRLEDVRWYVLRLIWYLCDFSEGGVELKWIIFHPHTNPDTEMNINININMSYYCQFWKENEIMAKWNSISENVWHHPLHAIGDGRINMVLCPVYFWLSTNIPLARWSTLRRLLGGVMSFVRSRLHSWSISY